MPKTIQYAIFDTHVTPVWRTALSHSSLFLQLLILFGSSTLVATLCHSMRIPTIVGFILTGILVGPHGLKLIDSLSGAETLTQIGIVLLMFTIGLEFSIRRVMHLKRSFFFLGGMQVVITVSSVALLGRIFGDLGWSTAIFFGCLAAISSTAVVLKLLQENRELESPHGQSILGVSLFQDLAVIPMVLALPLFEEARVAPAFPPVSAIALWVVQLLAVVGLVGLGSRYAVPFLLTRVIRTRSRELFFFSILFLCFGVAWCADRMGLSLSFGAFVAGMMLAESTYARQATSEVVLLRDNFLGLFFVSIGMLLNVSFLLSHLHWILLAALLVVIIKSSLLYGAGRALRYSHQVAIMTGLILCQIGEFSFILANFGLEKGVLTPDEFQYFLCVSILLVGATPLIYRFSPHAPRLMSVGEILKSRVFPGNRGLAKEVESQIEEILPRSMASSLHQGAEQNPPAGAPHGDGMHAIIIGYGLAGQNLGTAFSSLGIPFKVIELNYDVARENKDAGNVLFGDATRDEILEQAGIKTAKLVVVLVSGVQMIQGVLAAVMRIRPDVRVLVRSLYVRDMWSFSLPVNGELVVSEFETSIEILARALTEYGVSSGKIHTFMVDARKHLGRTSQDAARNLRRTLEMPAWEALAAIRPIQLTAKDFVVGKSIGELSLRSVTGASVVSVFREFLGTVIPKPDFVFQSGDVVHLIGAPEAIAASEQFFQAGQMQA